MSTGQPLSIDKKGKFWRNMEIKGEMEEMCRKVGKCRITFISEYTKHGYPGGGGGGGNQGTF